MAQLNDLVVTGKSRFLNEINGKIDWTNINNKPTIPTVNNATLTIQKNGTNVQTFTANQSTNATANITVPTKVSELTNDKGYTSNTGTITGIKMNGASKGTSGVVDLGTVITAHQDISGKVSKTGDTMSGALNFANATKNSIGDDVAIGDFNVTGTLGIQGLNGVTGIGLIKQGETWNANADYAKITYGGSGITINKSIYLPENTPQMIQFIGGTSPLKHTNTLDVDSITIQQEDSSKKITKGISINVDDINLIGSNNNGWDGTNTSLKAALGAKLNCSWTAIANSQYNYTTAASDSASWGQVITNNSALKTANEVMVRFTNARISPIILHLDGVAEYVTFLSSADSYKLCVGALWDKTNGKISVRCTCNGWGYTSVPVTIGASNIYYR